MARTITTREEWNAVPVGRHVLVQYAGNEGDGPGDVVFVRFAETLRWDYGAYRMSGGLNWDAVWDHTEAAAVLEHSEAKERYNAHQAADLKRALASYYEVARRRDDEAAVLAKPFGGLRLARRRIFG